MRAVLRPLDADDGRLVEKVAKLVIATVTVALTAILLCGCDDIVTTDTVARAHGMPLDACEVVEYDRPAWLPKCKRAYKVYDRQTGDAWWLLDMGYDSANTNNYMVLPLEGADR